MVAIKHELDTVQAVKEEIEELREYVDRLEEHSHRRKLRLLEQVTIKKINENKIETSFSKPNTVKFAGSHIFPVVCNIGRSAWYAPVRLQHRSYQRTRTGD